MKAIGENGTTLTMCNSSPHRRIGLLPAGGIGSRIAPLPMSKELYPLGFRQSPNGVRSKVVGHYLLDRMRLAAIEQAFLILRPGKWDIPDYFGDGAWVNMHLAYLTVHTDAGVPYTLDQAYPFVQDAMIALGFPDILIEPTDAFVRLFDRQSRTQADVVLGLFPTDNPQKVGVVEFDETGQVFNIIEKSPTTTLRWMWAIAIWSPRFTEFLHLYIKNRDQGLLDPARSPNTPLAPPAAPEVKRPELPIGDVIQAAIESGDLRVEAECFPDGSYLDIGTPDDLQKAVQRFASEGC